MKLHETRTRSFARFLSLLALACFATASFGQGVQTGQVRGQTTTADGESLPGVTVTVSSPALQGTRSAVTTAAGDYLVRGLTPGDYTVTYSLDGMETATREVTVSVGTVSVVDVELGVSSVAETIIVQGTATPLDTSETTYNISYDTVDELAVTRDLDSIADLAPGLTLNTPNANQVAINGAMAYDNVWLMEGVEVNDNLFGSFDSLFIEDAILETQVLTSGISAEYGRFSGGVINVTTRSGGNDLRGSLRTDLTNNDWRERNPFEVENDIERTDKTNDIWMATLGGRIVTDRLWYFLAGRQRDTADADPLDVTGLAFDQQTENDRFEAKLTANFNQSHSVTGTYIENDQTQLRKNFAFTIDPATVFSQETPNDLKVLRYNGVYGSNVFADLHYSEKVQKSISGGTQTDIRDSPFVSFGFVRPVGVQHYNGTYFDATDPENRDNEQIAGSVSLFQSSERFGSHDVKIGGESFTSISVGGNSQSPTGLVFLFDYEINADGSPQFDANGRLIPVFEFGVINQWIPARGSRLETQTDSLYVNDRWQLGRWSFNLGARFEQVDSEATGDLVAVDTDRVVPRLGASFDLLGDGRFRADATYAQYAGGYNANIVSSNSNVNNPSLVQYLYVGPPGKGRDFDPGFDLNNYVPVFARFPSANVFFENDLHSPVTEEITLGFGAQLGRKGYIEATYIDRDMDDLIESFITLDLGTTSIVDPLPIEVDNQELRNTDIADRQYKAVQLQGRYQITSNWSLQGNYTYQIENEGNFEGEATNQPAIQSTIGSNPEFYSPERNFPFGRLAAFQRHKVRLWSNYRFELGRFGHLNVGGLVNYDSGTPYSLIDNSFPITAEQAANDPGYASPPTSSNVFFGERGSQLFDDVATVDLALRYGIDFGRFQPWLKVEIFNLFDNDKLVTWDNEISGNTGGPVDSLGLPTTFTEGPNFGQATDDADYAVPRELRLSVGLRF